MRLQNLSAVINLVQGLVFKAADSCETYVHMCKDGVVITMWNGRKYVVTVKEVK